MKKKNRKDFKKKKRSYPDTNSEKISAFFFDNSTTNFGYACKLRVYKEKKSLRHIILSEKSNV